MTDTTITDTWIEAQIDEGTLSPGARGISATDAADQYNRANGYGPGDPGFLVAPAEGQAQRTDGPQVWIGCLSCYTDGELVGEWFPAEGAGRVTVAQVHTGAVEPWFEHEELWVMDSEGIPVTTEMDPMTAAKWGEIYAEVDASQWPAFCAWVQSGDYTTGGDDMPDVAEFTDRYAGEWMSFADYAFDYVTDAGLLNGLDETIVRYFDHAAFGRDLEVDYTTASAPGGGVYVFRTY